MAGCGQPARASQQQPAHGQPTASRGGGAGRRVVAGHKGQLSPAQGQWRWRRTFSHGRSSCLSTNLMSGVSSLRLTWCPLRLTGFDYDEIFSRLGLGTPWILHCFYGFSSFDLLRCFKAKYLGISVKEDLFRLVA
ncbi:hypothetical protein BHE74_00020246 [Ensete ventricosum]|nr:hypothetical protein BHE74_00020246 [Ensete ventricosum]